MTSHSTPPPPRGLAARVAAGVIVAEAATLIIAGISYVVYVLRGVAESVAVSLSISATALAVGALLAVSGSRLWRGRDYAVGAVVTWQVLQLAIGGQLVTASPGLAAAIVIPALVVNVVLIRAMMASRS